MADGDGVAHQLAVHEERHEEGVVRRVQAAPVGVVVHDDIALGQPLARHLAHAALDDDRHAADVSRAEVRRRDHVALRVGEDTGEVEGLVEDRRVRRLHQGDAHFPTDGEHRALEDAHRHDILGRPLTHGAPLHASSQYLRGAHAPRGCRNGSRPYGGRQMAGAGRASPLANSVLPGQPSRWVRSWRS